MFPQANGTLLAGDIPDVADLPVWRGHGEVVSCWHLPVWQRLCVLFTGVVWLRVKGETHPPVQVQGGTMFERPRTIGHAQ